MRLYLSLLTGATARTGDLEDDDLIRQYIWDDPGAVRVINNLNAFAVYFSSSKWCSWCRDCELHPFQVI